MILTFSGRLSIGESFDIRIVGNLPKSQLIAREKQR